ncbi:MAG: orotidine-5'-phosphate decarboxylase [Candidatus Goldbacteria bacterium]|nr:orotidine-5'-phosphate decarboxylase [Candidatus Goldiibacteriota bacterium]
MRNIDQEFDVRDKLILGLDIDDTAIVYTLIDKLAPFIKFYKVGLQLITKDGPRIVMTLKRKGLKVFYDAKFFDIPQTVYNACYEATRLGVNFLNVHAMGGSKMIKFAKQAIEDASNKLQVEKPKLLAVTVLTSFENKEIKNILKTKYDIKKMVIHLAKMAKKSGADGVVCSPKEIRLIRRECGKDFLIVTPGIRIGKIEKDDQKRIMTPYEAIKHGADYIVVSRPIIQAEDKIEVVEKIINQMQEAYQK